MNNSQSDKLNARAGFTLVELIVASTLMTLVLAGVYTAFSTAVRTWRSGEVNYETYDDARRAFGLLTRELHAIPSNALHLLNGADESIEFITLSEPMNVESGWSERLMLVRYRLLPGNDDEGMTLLREEALVEGPLPAARPEEDRRDPLDIDLGRDYTFELAREVEGLSFYYMWARRARPGPPLEPPAWAEIVGDSVIEEAVPEGIEIVLTLRDPGTGAEIQEATFREVITFRGETSVAPKYLVGEETR